MTPGTVNLEQHSCERCGKLYVVSEDRSAVRLGTICSCCLFSDEAGKINMAWRWHTNPRPSASIIVDLSTVT